LEHLVAGGEELHPKVLSLETDVGVPGDHLGAELRDDILIDVKVNQNAV
jgi:hypothetical protein